MIRIVCVTPDGRLAVYGYTNLEEFKQRWEKGDGIPMLDDILSYARVNKTDFFGETVHDFMEFLKGTYGWEY